MVAVNEVIYAHHLKFDDRRSKNGAFWILHDDSNPTVNAKLQRLGFRYKAPRGWWKE